MADQWHISKNWKYITPEFVTRDYNFEKFKNREELTDSDCDAEYRRTYKEY